MTDSKEIRYFMCDSIGSTFAPDIRLEERTNCDGSKYWHAEQDIGTLFGQEVHGACSGIGLTKKQAIQHLEEDKKKLNESLWI